MSILKSNNGKELIVSCDCGCDDGVHIRIEKDCYEGLPDDTDTYAYVTCIGANWYRDQDEKVHSIIWKKLKKIWAIIRNKDFYYSEVCMTKEDFDIFKEYINSIE
ncbi:hypothetical protein H8S37_04115 [Mediterraneibacter sp. NSJ-55]|uniref:Uncharacterized protein n=1 Tax=Mediterraneibacter hominis TaxID=2763054 RepID=A0A923LGY9_9FIRM|nr:hypothetical protein [Mediterraneibacter hominis]MBC5688118.1 hypothetical protein [Mediterraneibacter hominis]